ncbi:aminotransferase class V-fold PLP-dependent enzyme [Gaetbulibacter sp. M235]|uniref:aminotransferase class V-fold PLP-dependent enzyme n=1 Tax=Gaetbulibacter sp. M235 TaxID=3126510 RepID=UPI00374F3084
MEQLKKRKDCVWPKGNDLENYFEQFRKHIIGINQNFKSPYGEKEIIYADWTASGRLFRPIEEKIINEIGPFVANTHTETSITGSTMTMAYHEARNIIKKHVNASKDDVLITVGSGMTGAINKFQRILGVKVNENLKRHTVIPQERRPIVFVSHMEHHSNHTSWMETICEVVIIPHNEEGLISIEALDRLLKLNRNRQCLVAITACSNVTGVIIPIQKIAVVAHLNGAICIVDYACSAPYVEINMHKNEMEFLDAIVFSPHKFLGGPGTSGVLIFNKHLYKNQIPDQPGGGTVIYTNPWGDRKYYEDIEIREEGGTPGFLQTIKIALAIQLKEKMGIDNILAREHEINNYVFKMLSEIKGLNILAKEHKDRLSIFSFHINDSHYNLIVKLLNDLYGIQTRGGCSCAGTYGHYLLNVDKSTSKSIEQKIVEGCFVDRPGWIRMSFHPTMTNREIEYVCEAIKDIVENIESLSMSYTYDVLKNEFVYHNKRKLNYNIIQGWFD